jgi:hypothetical protein
MMGVLRILFPHLDRRKEDRFRDARVRDSIARSEQVLAIHDRLSKEVQAVAESLPRKDPARGAARDPR